jgi:hypothetical protein
MASREGRRERERKGGCCRARVERAVQAAEGMSGMREGREVSMRREGRWRFGEAVGWARRPRRRRERDRRWTSAWLSSLRRWRRRLGREGRREGEARVLTAGAGEEIEGASDVGK